MSKAAWLVGKQEDPSRTEVNVAAAETALVVGGEIIEQRELSTAHPELKEAVADRGGGHAHSIKRSVAGCDVDIAARVSGQPGAAHPDAAQAAIRRRIENTYLRKRGRIEGKHPTVIGERIAVRSVGDEYCSVHQQEPRPIELPQRDRLARCRRASKDELAAGASVAGPCNSSGDDHRARRLFRAGRDVERVQAMDEDATFLRIRLDVHGSGRRVNDRSAGDPHLWSQVAAADVRTAAQ